METWKLQKLTQYDVNDKIRRITPESFTRLKSDLNRDGQLDNLLITPEGVVLGGNHRLKAMQELGWETAKCDIVDFIPEDEGWVALLNGEPQRSHFHKTEEAAMLYYSIKDNNSYATYNQDQLITFASQFDIPLEEIHVYFDEPINLQTSIDGDENINREPQYKLIIQTPDKDSQLELYTKLTGEGYKCTIQS